MPEQPSFPMTSFSFAPDGVTLQIVLAPGFVISQKIGEEAMNQVCKQWLETRKEIGNQLALIENIRRSKTN